MYESKPARIRAVPIVLAGIAALCAAACLDDYDPCADEVNTTVDPDQALIWPPVVHTGYNGRDTFLAPISTNFYVESWVVGDESVLSVVPKRECGTPGLYEVSGLVQTRAAGTTTVTAVSGDVQLSVGVVVTGYTTEQTDIGEQRYRDPAPPQGGDRLACASCHEAQGGVDHTPLEMAFHDDEAILSATMYGKYPDLCTDAAGAACECGSADECTVSEAGYQLNTGHEWNLTPGEADGIVAYMRALRPRGL